VTRCVHEDDSNVDLKDLALCYPGLPKVVEQVECWIATGIEGHLKDNDDYPIPDIVSIPSSPTHSIETEGSSE
jgi:hypothetical protein